MPLTVWTNNERIDCKVYKFGPVNVPASTSATQLRLATGYNMASRAVVALHGILIIDGKPEVFSISSPQSPEGISFVESNRVFRVSARTWVDTVTDEIVVELQHFAVEDPQSGSVDLLGHVILESAKA